MPSSSADLRRTVHSPCCSSPVSSSPRSTVASSADHRLETAQERDQVGFLLRREDEAKADFVKTHGVQQCLSRPIVEKRRTGGETAQNWPFDLADMVEFAVDQGLAEVGRVLQSCLPGILHTVIVGK